MTRTSDVDSEGNSSYARTIVTIPPPAQLVSPVAAVTRDTGLFDLANFPRAPSGALQVADKLHLDGGHFINTGFVQADTIHLDHVDLVNTRRLADVHYTEYQSRRQWTLIGGESVQPGGFMSASHWIIDNKPTQIGEAANGDPIYLDGGKITCNSCNFDIPGFNDEHLDSFFRLLKSTYGDHFELNRLLDNLHLQSIGKAPWHQRYLNVILVVAAIVLSVLCYETCVPIVADWLKAIGATGAKALSPYVVAALGTLSMQFIAAAATGNWDLSSILQAVILTVVTAGLTYGITGAVSDAVGVDLYAYGINNASGVVSNWGEYAAAAGTRAVISSGVSTVVNGGDLKDAFLASFVSNLSPGIANAIGQQFGNVYNIDGSINGSRLALNSAVHAAAGCALAAAKQEDCGAGATGAGVAALGSLLFDRLFDETDLRTEDRNRSVEALTRLTAIGVVAATGGAEHANTADFFAQNEVQNNFVTKADLGRALRDLAGCKEASCNAVRNSLTSAPGGYQQNAGDAVDRCRADQQGCAAALNNMVEGLNALADPKVRALLGDDLTDRLINKQSKELDEVIDAARWGNEHSGVATAVSALILGGGLLLVGGGLLVALGRVVAAACGSGVVTPACVSVATEVSVAAAEAASGAVLSGGLTPLAIEGRLVNAAKSGGNAVKLELDAIQAEVAALRVGDVKTGTKLLQQFNSVESVIQNAGKLTRLKGGVRQGFITGNADDIFTGLSKQYGANIQTGANGQRFFQSGNIRVDLTGSSGNISTLRINNNGQLFKIRVQ